MTAADFDPYHKWLGIPPEDQPPTFYRLLGIAPFEADSDVIANAANRQIVHLRQMLGGANRELAARLLAEVGTAKTTLLSPQEKTKYDQSLATVHAPATADVEPPAETDSPIEEIGQIVVEPTFRRKVKKPPRRSPLVPLLVRAVPFLAIGGVLAFLLVGPGKHVSAAGQANA